MVRPWSLHLTNMREVYIIGGANIDIIGRSDHTLLPFDSNIGKVIQSFGGVGRNIAENAARLGACVHFVSVVGDDDNGQACLRYCEACGIDISECLIVKQERTSTYLAVLDEMGDMRVAINDMDILRFLDQQHIDHVLKKVKKDDILVLDTNLDQKLIVHMMEKAPCDVFVDPISCKKAEKLEGLLKHIHVFKPNVYEAEHLSGIHYDSEASVDQMGAYFLDQGIDEVYISLGQDGVKGFTKNHTVYCCTKDAVVSNATGAGDAFMGGLIVADLLHYSFLEKIKFAQSCSICTIETDESVCGVLSVDYVQKRKENLVFKIKEKKTCI